MTQFREAPKRFLLIGGASYFGRHFLEAAQEHFPQSEFVLTSRWHRQGEHWRTVDPGNWNEVSETLQRVRPDCVVNFAATVSGPFLCQQRVNAQIPMIVSRCLANVSRNSRLVLIGSAAEYGVSRSDFPFHEDSPHKPSSSYGLTKSTQSSLFPTIAKLVPDCLLIRPFNLFGDEVPSHSVFSRLLHQLNNSAKAARPILKAGFLGDYRDFVSVTIASATLSSLIHRAQPGAVHNIGSGVAQEVRRFVTDWLAEHEGVGPDAYEISEKGRREPNYSRADVTATSLAIREGP